MDILVYRRKRDDVLQIAVISIFFYSALLLSSRYYTVLVLAPLGILYYTNPKVEVR